MTSICKYFQMGTCSRGSDCKFRHESVEIAPTICKYANRPGGGCRDANCPFEHPATAPPDPNKQKITSIVRPDLPDIPLPEAKNGEERAARAAAGLPAKADDVAEYQRRLFDNSMKRIVKASTSAKDNNNEGFSFDTSEIRFALDAFSGDAERSADYLWYCRQQKLDICDRGSLVTFQQNVA